MAKIFNLNHDVYINCHYVQFYNYFKSTRNLNFGDMISLKENHLNYLKIVGLDNKLIKPDIINNTKCILEEYITSYLYNPIVQYQQLSHMIYYMKLSTNHILFTNILDKNVFSKLQFIFRYKQMYHLEIKILKHNIRVLYKVNSLLEKDTKLIKLMTIMNGIYIGIKRDILISTDTVDIFYRRLNILPNYWKIQSCNQKFINNNTIVTLELLIPECDLNIIDTILY